MNSEQDKFIGLEIDDGPGPMKSVEGYIIVITSLHQEAQEEDIHDVFGGFGQIKSLHLNMDKRTGYAKGYAFIEYEELGEARQAIDKMNGQMLLGQTIKVDWAFKRPPKNEK